MIELQISARAFLAMQRETMRAAQRCPPPPLAIGGRWIQVQEIEFLDNTLRHDVPADFTVFYRSHGAEYAIAAEGFATQIAQDVRLHVADMADVLGRPNAAPANVMAIPLTAVLTIRYYPLEGRCFLHTSLDHLEWGTLPALPPGINPDDVKAAVTDMLGRALASKAVPLNFAGALSEGRARVENAGVTVDTDLQRVVFRATTGGATSYASTPWGNFFRGFVPDRTAGADWAYFVSKGMLEVFLTNRMDSALREVDSPRLHLVSVGSAYSNDGGRPSVTTTVYANIDLPDPLGMSSVQPAVRTEFSVAAANALAVDVFLPDVEDVAAGALGLGSAALARVLLGPLWELVASGLSDASIPTIPLPDCQQLSPVHQRCSLAAPMPSLSGIALRFDGIAALPDGIGLTGPLRIPETTRAGVTTQFQPFAWTPPDVSCGSAGKAMLAHFMDNPRGRALMRARVFVDNTGTAPASLCRVEARNDPLGLFGAAAIAYTPGPLPAEIVVTVPNPDYGHGQRYPLDLLVTTTVGTRLVRIPPATELTDEDVTRLTAGLLVAIGDCMQLVAPWFQFPGGFNPQWHIDPPPWEAQFEHLWTFEISGLQQGQAVSLVDAAGQEVASALARPSGPTRLTALAPPSARLALTMPGAHQRATGDDGRGPAGSEGGDATPPLDESDEGVTEWLASSEGIDVRQQVWAHTASVALSGAGRYLVAVPPWGRYAAAAVIEDGLDAFDLAAPHRPSRLGTWSIPGIRGAVVWGGELLAFGARGLVVVGPDGRLEQVGDPSLSVADTIVVGERLCVLTEDGLEFRDDRRCVVARSDAAGGRALIRLGGRMVVAGPDGIRACDLAGDGSVSPGSERRDLDVDRLMLPPEGPHGSVLAVLADGSARLLALSGDRLEDVATYPTAPWFAGSLRMGDILLQIGSSGREVDVGVVGTEHLAPAGPPTDAATAKGHRPTGA